MLEEYIDYLKHLNDIKLKTDIYVFSRDQIGNYYNQDVADKLMDLGMKTDFFLERSQRNDNWFAYLAVIKNAKLRVEKVEKKSVKIDYDDENISIISTRWSKKYGNLNPVVIDKKNRRSLLNSFKNFRGLIFVVYKDGEFLELKAFDTSWKKGEITTSLALKRENIYENYYSKITTYSRDLSLKHTIIDLIIQEKYNLASEILRDVIFDSQVVFDWIYEYYIGLQFEYLNNIEGGRVFFEERKALISPQSNIHKFINKYDDKHLLSKLILSDYFEANKESIKQISSKIFEDTNRFSEFPVFVYWGQGFEQAPDIVKASFGRLKKIVPKEALIVLSDENIGDYIDLPDYVINLSRTNKANYSDYLRFALLAKYGGAWVDATLFVSEDFYDQLLNFNAIKSNYPMDGPITVMGSWFRIYKQSSHLGEKIMQATTMFWLQHFKSFPFYFFIDFLEQYYSDSMIEDGKERDVFPWQGRNNSFLIRNNLGNKFNVDWSENILSKTPVHKLNYKLSDWENLKKDDSIYSAIINKQYPFN